MDLEFLPTLRILQRFASVFQVSSAWNVVFILKRISVQSFAWELALKGIPLNVLSECLIKFRRVICLACGGWDKNYQM